MKWTRSLAIGLLMCGGGLAAVAQETKQDEPASKPPKPSAPSATTPLASPRELLRAYGVDDSHFRMFVDGAPLDDQEQEPLLRFLYGIRRFSDQDCARWAKKGSPNLERSQNERGSIYHLTGKVMRVSRHKPLEELARRFELPEYYRCQLLLEPDAMPATAIALAVPQKWKLDAPMQEPVSLHGFYLKFVGEEGLEQGGVQPVFAAKRIAWHSGLLGQHGMDMGLFDQVKNKAPLTSQDRDCFYQLLSAAGRMDADELLQLTRRAPADDYSVVPLFNDPANQHGKLFALTGTARRAMLVKLDPRSERDTIERYGLDHYYQIEIFTHDSQSNPLVFCVRELPPGMPQGPNIYETVRIPGFFFKTWAYPIQGTDEQPAEGLQLAPMLIGRQPQWLRGEPATNPLYNLLAGGLFLSILGGIVFCVWRWNRGDRRFRQRAIAGRFEPATNRSLNDLGIEAENEPDFRNLP